jgi:DNA-binding response OmpR family regulator
MSLRRYDLILLDIMLPGQDGLSLCGELRKITFCPIIFISCLNDDETAIRALNMGGDDYLIKPFQDSVLLVCIEANLRRYPLPPQ